MNQAIAFVYKNSRVIIILALCWPIVGCVILHENSKYNFNDGVYSTKQFSRNEVYVVHVDEDTIAVFPVLQFGDSSSIITSKRTTYATSQRKLKDKKATAVFYKKSFDLDLLTIPLKYRPYERGIPNQLHTNFNGALFGGYRIDEYKLQYKRNPLNIYKQKAKHSGYSAGLYLGIGSTVINQWVMKEPNFLTEYEGVTLTSGISINMAVNKLDFGLSIGVDHLMDKYSSLWIYQGRPCLGFTLGLDIN
jgi:hypothetical protein